MKIFLSVNRRELELLEGEFLRVHPPVSYMLFSTMVNLVQYQQMLFKLHFFLFCRGVGF